MKYLLVIITGLIFNTLSVYSYSETLHQLKERYEIIEKDLELYHVELEKIVNRKDSSLVDYEKLANKTWQLKKILEDLDQKLKANHNALDKNKNPFLITARLENYNGPEINNPLVNGDIIAFSAEVPTLIYDNTSGIGYLIWQLYDNQENPVEGVQKVRQISENGTQQSARFRFKINNLPNGKYTVALLHQIEGVNHTQSAISQFTIEEPLLINRLVVSNKSENPIHQSVLLVDDAPHGFVYFSLGEAMQEVNVKLQMIDLDTGNIIADEEVTRERIGNGGEQRVGMRLEPGYIKAGKKMTFTAILNTQNGLQKIKSTNFEIEQLEKIAKVDQKKNEELDGLWFDYYENGNLREKGYYKNGKVDGLWEEYFEDGQLSIRKNYKNGILDGLYENYHENGNLEEIGYYNNGKKDGLWEIYFEDGQIAHKWPFKNDSFDGNVESYYKNGKLSFKGNYINREEDGIFYWYYENGQKNRIRNYKNGKQDGIEEYYWESGESSREMFRNGKKHGPTFSYYDNGKLKFEGNYINGEDNGIWKYYHYDGSLERTETWKDGKEDGLWKFYHNDGSLEMTETWKNGVYIKTDY